MSSKRAIADLLGDCSLDDAIKRKRMCMAPLGTETAEPCATEVSCGSCVPGLERECSLLSPSGIAPTPAAAAAAAAADATEATSRLQQQPECCATALETGFSFSPLGARFAAIAGTKGTGLLGQHYHHVAAGVQRAWRFAPAPVGRGEAASEDSGGGGAADSGDSGASASCAFPSSDHHQQQQQQQQLAKSDSVGSAPAGETLGSACDRAAAAAVAAPSAAAVDGGGSGGVCFPLLCTIVAPPMPTEGFAGFAVPAVGAAAAASSTDAVAVDVAAR